MQLYEGHGIQATQAIDEIQIDFSPSLYHVDREEVLERCTAGILAGEISESNLDLLDQGHIGNFFCTQLVGPVRPKNYAMKMVKYILSCAAVGS